MQQDEDGPFAKESVDNPIQELVLSEFLEAIARYCTDVGGGRRVQLCSWAVLRCRCGYVKWEDADMTVVERIQRAVDAVVALAPPETHAKRAKPVSRLFAPGLGAGAAGAGARRPVVRSFITEGAGIPGVEEE